METSPASPAPESNPDANAPTLNVVPKPAPEAAAAPAPAPAPEPAPESKAPSPGAFNKQVEAELSRTAAICVFARKPEYAGALATRGIAPAFLDALDADVALAGQKSQGAVDCDSAAKDATQTESDAARKLVESLQSIQGAARVQHLPDHPALLDGYLIGESLADSRPLLERSSQKLIDKANAERPAGMNTDFIIQVADKRGDYVAAGGAQSTEESKAKLERARRGVLLKSIIARRKKIQYAADSLWPPRRPESAQARKDFKIPANRPYSY